MVARIHAISTQQRWAADLDSICTELERLGAVAWEPWPHIIHDKAPAALVELYTTMVQVGCANGWNPHAS